MTASQIEEKRLFLVVSASPSKLEWISSKITGHISNATVFQAEDGSTALSKFQNAKPHVLITDLDLPKIDGMTVVDRALRARGADTTTIIIADHPPKEERHLDELATGRIQYWMSDGTETDESTLISCVVKALNYASKNPKAEFHVLFLNQGDVLIREGEKAESIYFVKKGQLQASKRGEDGHTIVLGIVEYGEFVGEMAYINGEPRSATVTALTSCELIEVPLGHFENVLFRRPSWSKALMLTLSKRVKKANQEKD